MNFYRIISEAIKDIEQHGFDSQYRIENWLIKIRDAAKKTMISEAILTKNINKMMQNIYRKMIDRGDILKMNIGVERFTLEKLKPKLRNELDRRIMASASLIKMNREESINKTLQRFAGWATSVPAGGSDAVDKTEVKETVRKSLQDLPFAERRVLIDQGHKFTAGLNQIIASDGGAIAAIWHSHWRQKGYDYREDHKERDGKVYAIRNNWAIKEGLMKVGEAGYTDEITMVGEEPFCRCNYQYLYNLRDLPADMITKKGNLQLFKARAINA